LEVPAYRAQAPFSLIGLGGLHYGPSRVARIDHNLRFLRTENGSYSFTLDTKGLHTGRYLFAYRLTANVFLYTIAFNVV
jgi:hypothetical protein